SYSAERVSNIRAARLPTAYRLLPTAHYVGPGRARLERLLPTLLYRVALTAILVFIAAPVAVVFLASVNSTQFLRFPPEGLSTRWWEAALTERWIGPTVFSLRLAALTAVFATALGTLAALG